MKSLSLLLLTAVFCKFASASPVTEYTEYNCRSKTDNSKLRMTHASGSEKKALVVFPIDSTGDMKEVKLLSIVNIDDLTALYATLGNDSNPMILDIPKAIAVQGTVKPDAFETSLKGLTYLCTKNAKDLFFNKQ